MWSRAVYPLGIPWTWNCFRFVKHTKNLEADPEGTWTSENVLKFPHWCSPMEEWMSSPRRCPPLTQAQLPICSFNKISKGLPRARHDPRGWDSKKNEDTAFAWWEPDGEHGGGTAQRGGREFSLVSQFSMLSDLTSQPQRFRSDCSESRITFRIELLPKAPLKSTRPSFSSDDSEQRKRWGSRASPGLSPGLTWEPVSVEGLRKAISWQVETTDLWKIMSSPCWQHTRECGGLF